VNSILDKVFEKPNEGNDDIIVQAAQNDKTIFNYFNNNNNRLEIETVSDYTNHMYATAGGNDDIKVANLAANIGGGSYSWEIYSGRGNDTITGGSLNDTLYGGVGNDTLFGGAGRDSLFGGVGNDSMFGGIGNDALFGGADNDTLLGQSGINNLQGFDINSSPNASEKDTLENSVPGSLNRFFLATPDNNSVWKNGYKNGGNADYAEIIGYDTFKDVIGVANTFTITRAYDAMLGGIAVRDMGELIALVKGITNVADVKITTAAEISTLP